jgi:hypothetical protein
MQTGCNEDVLELARELNRLRHSVLGAQKRHCKIPLLAVISKRKLREAFALNRY